MIDNDIVSLEGIQMPWNLEAEQAVLGSILVNPGCLSLVTVYVKAEYFYLEKHSKIFSAIVTLDEMGKKPDALAVLDELVAQNVFDNAAGKKYLLMISQAAPSTENVEIYAGIVREKYYARRLIKSFSEAADMAAKGSETVESILDSTEQQILNIRQDKLTDIPSKLGDIIINDVYVTLKNITGEDKDLYQGYTTGFPELDSVLTGLHKSDLIIVGARPAMGKTSFALNIARNVALLANRRVLMFSLEMTKEQLAMRVLGTEARISSMKMRHGNISDDEWKRIGRASGVLSDCELYFDDTTGITVPEMKAKARRLKSVECIVIDYLGLIASSEKSENRVKEITKITGSLKKLAKDLNIPVICLAQLSRGTEARGKSHRPQLSDFRESGSIVRDADIVLMLYRDDYYRGEKSDEDETDGRKDDVSTVSVIIAKNKHGETGTVDLIWNKEHGLFIDKSEIIVHSEE